MSQVQIEHSRLLPTIFSGILGYSETPTWHSQGRNSSITSTLSGKDTGILEIPSTNGKVYNAHRMSHFFPAKHGGEFLMDWYNPDIEEMPQIPAPASMEIPRRSGRKTSIPKWLGIFT